MRVFLTGVSGYLGSVLAEHLAQAPEVQSITGIDVVEPTMPLPSKVRYMQLDTRSSDLPGAMAGHDVIVHTACIVQWLAKMPAPEREDINLNGTSNVAQAAVANQVQRFIHASSVAAYDLELGREKKSLAEDFPVGKGDSFFYYANDKAATERILTKALASSGITLTMFRPHFIMGPRNSATVEFLRGNAVKYRGLNPRLQYVHEDDVASAFLQAVTSEMPGVYNIALDDCLYWSEVLKSIGKDSAPTMPVWMTRLIAAITWRFFGAPSHPSWIDAGLVSLTMSNTKLKATGWLPRYSSEEALRASL